MMAKYKPYSYAQGQFIPVFFHKQLQKGTFEYSLNYLIDNTLDLSFFDTRYNNDETGSPAYDPRILLKIILFAYSRGITSSRNIAKCCEENVVFMALSANTKPHFTTIAKFISTMDKEVVRLFVEVLLVCEQENLIGKEMFAIDGCKLPSNASKEWSGTKADLRRKLRKMETAITRMMEKHCSEDTENIDSDSRKKDDQYITRLEKNAAKVRKFLDENDDRKGSGGRPVKSNITDNESAKMMTSKGVIQGYVGVTGVDDKHQVIVHAEAYGQGSEHDLLKPTVIGIRSNFEELENSRDVFETARLTADSGYHSEANMEFLFTENINAFVADKNFRQRDPRYASAERYRSLQNRSHMPKRGKLFSSSDFTFAEDLGFAVCPAGQRLYRNGGNVTVKNYRAVKFKGPKSSCKPCKLRHLCLRNPEKTDVRQLAYFSGRSAKGNQRFTEKMKAKIDSVAGRAVYATRLAVGEPPFAHIRSVMKLDRFSHRGKKKVNTQWNLFCTVHNLKKIHSYGGCVT